MDVTREAPGTMTLVKAATSDVSQARLERYGAPRAPRHTSDHCEFQISRPSAGGEVEE